MNRSTLSFVIGLVLGLLVATGSAQAQSSAHSGGGSITAIDGDTLTLCFRHAPVPAVGDTLSLEREWIPFSKGTPASPRYIVVGHARVVAVGAPPCVQAERLDGKPRRYDRARPDAAISAAPAPQAAEDHRAGLTP
jgi:hypothetical protein